MSRYPILIALPFAFASCDSPESTPAPVTHTEVIEVLEHQEGSFSRTSSIEVGAIGSNFTVDGVEFTISHLWPHAETTRNVTDDADASNHGVEVAWKNGAQEKSQWVFQTDSDETMSTIEPVGALVRVTPPGARPPREGKEDFSSTVQILWQGQLLDLPEIGGEVFEGWTLKESKSYQHALLDDEGGVIESPDGGFSNRVLQVHLTDGKGTEERHIAFLDHPEITRGIHPTILSVTRLSGDGASQSRLSVCTDLPPATQLDIVQISPNTDDQGLTVRVGAVGESGFKTIEVAQLPAEIPLTGDKSLILKQHFTRARAHVKWDRSETPKEGEARPAILIEYRASHSQKDEFVLIRDEVTPCRIGQKHLMLRYTENVQ